MDAAFRALEIAQNAGVRTILNPAPATDLPDGMLGLCDLITPNESEAERLTGGRVTDIASAEAAGRNLMDQGAGAAIVTMGEAGALYVGRDAVSHVPGLSAGPVIETTGAGDAFNGGLAVALAEGMPMDRALRFANATAAISVTRAGAAPSMPARTEIEALLG